MPTPNATLFDPVKPNFRDLTAERIGTVFAIIGATAAQGTAAVSFADAGADPATLGLRRAFHSALAMRLRMLKAKLRMAVIQHDLLGSAAPISPQWFSGTLIDWLRLTGGWGSRPVR